MNPKDTVGAKKAPMHLVPAAGAIFSAPAHQNGANKYGAFNWRLQPVQAMTYVAAIRRHIDAWVDGQDEAEDTGIHHFAHALAGLNILADAMGLGILIDDRPPKGPAADLLRAQDRSGVSPTAAVPAPEGPTAVDWANALLNMGPLQVGRGEPDRIITFQGIDLANGEDVTVRTTIAEAGAITHEIVSEEWGNGDGGIFTLLGDRFAVAGVDYRGEWPPDTRVAGRLTCCGQTEHPIDCPQWR
jgi:hypothetical protein